MNQYQNTGFDAGRSIFINTAKQLPSQATFSASRATVKTSSGNVNFVRGAIALRSNIVPTICGESCPTEVTESVKLEFSVLDGATSLADLKAEVDRLFTEAIAAYGFSRGLVPPVYANFINE